LQPSEDIVMEEYTIIIKTNNKNLVNDILSMSVNSTGSELLNGADIIINDKIRINASINYLSYCECGQKKYTENVNNETLINYARKLIIQDNDIGIKWLGIDD
jgi:hypothetical protein